MTDFLTIDDGSARVTLAPHQGGAVRAFVWRGIDILRPTPAGAGGDPFELACFPMVPFVNRIARGRFEFCGHTVELARNWSDDPHPLHGQGWRAPWTLAHATRTSATLTFEGGADEWPWRYHSEQRFALSEGELSIELALENRSVTAMPAMLGLHPYFPDAARAELQAELPQVWRTDAAALPLEQIETPPAWRFESARPIKSAALDHCFAGWNGVASLRWPDRSVLVRAASCGFLHVFAPAARDFFCIEPQTAPPGALARAAREATVLAPGERLAIEVHLAPGAP